MEKKISDYRKKKLVSALLNLYLFDTIEKPDFKEIDDILSVRVPNERMKTIISTDKNYRAFYINYLQKVYDLLPLNMKNDLYLIMLINSYFAGVMMFAVEFSQSNEVLEKFNQEIFESLFLENKQHPSINSFLYFLTDFRKFFIQSDGNIISKKQYNHIVRAQINELNSFEIN